MILHRLTNNLPEKNWLGFLLELILVVLGILIALAINDWSTGHKDRASEQLYLELLSRDLNQIEFELNEQIKYENDMIGEAVKAYEIIQSDTLSEQAINLAKLLTKVTSRRTLFLDSAAYTDLKSTGNLVLIQDRKLRDNLVRYFIDIERKELIIAKNNRNFIDEGFVPFIINYGLSYRLGVQNNSELNEMNLMMAEIFSESMKNPKDKVFLLPKDSEKWDELQKQLTWRAMISVNIKSGTQNILQSTIELRKTIESHLTIN